MRELLVGDVLWNSAARTPARVAASLEGQQVTFSELAVTTNASNPASSASRTVRSTSAASRGTYSWNQHGVAAAGGTLAGAWVLADDTS